MQLTEAPPIAPPTRAELDRVITTIEKNLRTWKGNADYGRFLEIELYCLQAQRPVR